MKEKDIENNFHSILLLHFIVFLIVFKIKFYSFLIENKIIDQNFKINKREKNMYNLY